MLKAVSSITNALGALNYKGTWNASTNTPALASGVGTKGDYYVVSVAGTTSLDGISNWGVGDWATFNGSVWQRVEGGADLNGVNVSFTGTASGPIYQTSDPTSAVSLSQNSLSATTSNTIVRLVGTSTTSASATSGANQSAGFAVQSQPRTTTGESEANLFLQANSFDGGNRVARYTLSVNPVNTFGQSELQIQYEYDGGGNSTRLAIGTSGAFYPGADGTQPLGGASNRWSVVYASTGTINTSDARSKQQVRELSDAERAVALKAKSMLRAFKFNDAVEQKGDGARIHFGILAQELAEAFASEGLDATKYAMFCYDEWEDKFEKVFNDVERIDEDNKISIERVYTGETVKVREAGNRYGVRYDQLLAFVIAAL